LPQTCSQQKMGRRREANKRNRLRSISYKNGYVAGRNLVRVWPQRDIKKEVILNTGIRGLFEKQCAVFGCGNTLMGDDGFGPAVIEYLQTQCSVPDNVTCIDVGTSIRDILFDLMLSEKRPQQIIIIDAADNPGKDTGDLYEIDIDGIAPAKANDFSLHQFPTTNMLKELKEGTGVDVKVFVVQTSGIPEAVSPGLSTPVKMAVSKMADLIMHLITTN